MDHFQRLLPIALIVVLAFLIYPFQADAQIFENPVPVRYRYQSGNANEAYTANLIQREEAPSAFQLNRWWGLAILLVPIGYFIYKKAREMSDYSIPQARGYQIVYQDISRPKKPRLFKTEKKPLKVA